MLFEDNLSYQRLILNLVSFGYNLSYQRINTKLTRQPPAGGRRGGLGLDANRGGEGVTETQPNPASGVKA